MKPRIDPGRQQDRAVRWDPNAAVPDRHLEATYRERLIDNSKLVDGSPNMFPSRPLASRCEGRRILGIKAGAYWGWPELSDAAAIHEAHSRRAATNGADRGVAHASSTNTLEARATACADGHDHIIRHWRGRERHGLRRRAKGAEGQGDSKNS